MGPVWVEVADELWAPSLIGLTEYGAIPPAVTGPPKVKPVGKTGTVADIADAVGLAGVGGENVGCC